MTNFATETKTELPLVINTEAKTTKITKTDEYSDL